MLEAQPVAHEMDGDPGSRKLQSGNVLHWVTDPSSAKGLEFLHGA